MQSQSRLPRNPVCRALPIQLSALNIVRGARMVKKLVACIMRGTIFDVDGIPASGGLLLSVGSVMALNYNPRPE